MTNMTTNAGDNEMPPNAQWLGWRIWGGNAWVTRRYNAQELCPLESEPVE